MGLEIGGRCETTVGPGRVVAIKNATRWKPASVTVALDSGGGRFFQPPDVWEADKPKKEAT